MAMLGMLGRARSHLGSFPVNTVQDRLEGGVRKAGLDTSLFVVLEPRAHSFRAVVEGIAEGFVDRLKALAASHKDLRSYEISLVPLHLTEESAMLIWRTHPLKGC